ncbi:hypothetical protein P7C70_g8436, partial [Phenoliferia sp. Uapishka_3]
TISKISQSGKLVLPVHHSTGSVARALTNTLLSIYKVTAGTIPRPRARQATIKPHHRLYSIPKTVTTSLKHLDLNPVLYRTISCTACFTQYDLVTPLVKCPQRFNTRSKICGASLRRPNGRPICQFATQSLIDWITKLVMRPGVEEQLRTSLSKKPPQDGRMRDVWDSPLWAELEAPKADGGHPFLSVDGNLAFSCFIDWFNPNGNKTAGKHSSVGAIVLFCLNLPPGERLKPHNIFVARIIPGPKEPSVLQINNLIRPLVSELLLLWTTGIICPTPGTTNGRVFRAALIALVCDLVAARKVAGLASHSAKFFCTLCLLLKEQMDSLDVDSWIRRSIEDHRASADAWRVTTLVKEREHIFKTTGIRHSLLDNLPYWDPLRMVVIDSMHNVSGVLENHARRILGIDVQATKKQEKLDTITLKLVAAALEEAADADEPEDVAEGDTD